jgi:hypothetical protein
VISEFLGGGGTATGLSEAANVAGAVLVQDLDSLESIKYSEYKQQFTLLDNVVSTKCCARDSKLHDLLSYLFMLDMDHDLLLFPVCPIL